MKKDFLNLIVSQTLRWGVWLAIGTSLVGLILYFSRGVFIDVAALPAKPVAFSIKSFLESLLAVKASAVMLLGVLLLLLGPALRVVFAFFAYCFQGNKLYSVITFLVVLIIAGSVYMGLKV